MHSTPNPVADITEDQLFCSDIRQPQLALEVADDDAIVILDFDETLFLSNSTEHFLNEARPSWLIAIILGVLAVIRPWRWGRGASEADDFFARDAWRIRTVCLLPWVRSSWQRRASALMAEFRNEELVRQLQNRRVVVATCGFDFIVRPMLPQCGLAVDRLIAGPMVNMARWRRRGKAVAVREAIGEQEVCRAIAISDSTRDQDVLDAVEHPVLRMWPDVQPIRAHSDIYLPLAYLSRVKRQGRREILRQVVLDDLMLLVLVFALVNPWSWATLGGLVCAFLAFFCVYEIGYRENDRLGEQFEENPRLTEAYLQGESGSDPGLWPWIFAGSFSLLASLLLQQTKDWPAVFSATTAWLGMLVATRIGFAIYNRLDEVTRVYVFPWLQVAKTFGFMLLLPTTLAGGAALLAQVVRRWQNYANYRAGGDEHRFPNLTTRLACYVLLIAVFSMLEGSHLLWHWHTWLLFAWFLIRGSRQIVESIQKIRWKGKPVFHPES